MLRGLLGRLASEILRTYRRHHIVVIIVVIVSFHRSEISLEGSFSRERRRFPASDYRQLRNAVVLIIFVPIASHFLARSADGGRYRDYDRLAILFNSKLVEWSAQAHVLISTMRVSSRRKSQFCNASVLFSERLRYFTSLKVRLLFWPSSPLIVSKSRYLSLPFVAICVAGVVVGWNFCWGSIVWQINALV